MSNQTKLTADERELLKQLRNEQSHRLDFDIFHFPERRVTIGMKYTPGHNAARVFVSLASPEETKYRKKVGEFHVRWAFEDYCKGYKHIGVPYGTYQGHNTPRDIAEHVADTLGVYS